MSKNIGIIFYLHGNKAKSMDMYDSISGKLREFFKWIVVRSSGDLYPATSKMDIAMEHFKISKATYYNWLNKLVECKLIKKEQPGVYKLNLNYYKALTEADKDLMDATKTF